MLQLFAWQSNETSLLLTSKEVDMLFECCKSLNNVGALNGKFKHACQVIYWQRLPKEN